MSVYKQVLFGSLGGLLLSFLLVKGVAWFNEEASATVQQLDKQLPVADWDLLAELDYKNGEVPADLKTLIQNQPQVRIPGYVVPLAGDDMENISEFLLVPVYGMCIHIPPPPPNQIIYAKMDKAFHYTIALEGIWLMGTLSVETMQSDYGSAGFVMKNPRVVPYETLVEPRPVL